MSLITTVAITTLLLRLSGLTMARYLSRWPATAEALMVAAPSLMGTYLAIQIIANPSLFTPVAIAMLVAWFTSTLYLSFVSAWLLLIALRHL